MRRTYMSERKSRIQKHLEENRQIVINGGVNCIPFPFNRFRTELPGIRRKFYYLISGATKSSKTQITNYLFIINSIFYYIKNPDKIKPTIHLFPLEETEDDITLRFYAYVLYYISKGKYCLSPEELESIDERSILPEEVLELMNSEEFNTIVQVFDECVTFHAERNPTGIYKVMKSYMENHGQVVTKEEEIVYKNSLGTTIKDKVTKIIDYIPNNSKEYVIFIVDHVGLLQQERGMSLKETIEKLSEYCVVLRNNYSAIPVIVQQQNSETTNLDAFRANKIRPTKDGLKDSKRTGEDCTVLLGITNPYSFELPEYLGYNIRKLKSQFRVLEVVLARKGRANGLCPLYFNGAINYYKELPLPDTEQMRSIYHNIDNPDNKTKNTTFLSYGTRKGSKKKKTNK